jgi:SAM-dependent methyltransferase
MSKQRSISVKLFGKDHQLVAAFPCHLATDLLTIVEAYRRGKQVRLSAERIDAVETALTQLCSSLHSIKEQIERLKQRSVEDFDADLYYDERRVKEYSAEFREVQHRHTSRCVYLLSSVKIDIYPVILDLGCGSGLSTEVLVKSFPFVVGLDASSAMLATASTTIKGNEFVQADFNQPLPFRQGVFDACSSTSAVHYVPPAVLPRFFAELERTVAGPVAAQLFCKGGIDELKELWLKGKTKLITDRPHHKHDRHYLLMNVDDKMETATPCPVCPTGLNSCGVFGEPSHCLLQMKGDRRHIEEEHWRWLDNEHSRFNHRMERLKRRRIDE